MNVAICFRKCDPSGSSFLSARAISRRVVSRLFVKLILFLNPSGVLASFAMGSNSLKASTLPLILRTSIRIFGRLLPKLMLKSLLRLNFRLVRRVVLSSGGSVAVAAMVGQSFRTSDQMKSRRPYSSRNCWPHCGTQWASSITTSSIYLFSEEMPVRRVRMCKSISGEVMMT